MTKVFQHTDGRLIVVPEDGIEPTTGNGWGELIPKVTLDQALAKARADFEFIAHAVGGNYTGVKNLPLAIVEEIEKRHAVARDIPKLLGCEDNALVVLRTIKDWKYDREVRAGHGVNDYEVIKGAPRRHPHCNACRDGMHLYGEHLGPIPGERTEDGSRDPVAQLATELYRMTTGGTELPAANPATADRYRRGARAILAAVRR